MQINSDERLNPQLKKEVQEVRGMINKGIESERFKKIPCEDRPAYTIIDTETQKQTTIPLFALSEVMNALHDLFE